MIKNKKMIMIIVACIIVLVAILALVKIFGGKGSAGTGSNSYSKDKVAFTCTKKDTTESGNARTWTADVVYGDNGYETKIYYKVVVDYLEMDDNKMLDILKELDPYGNLSANYNVNGTNNFGLTDYGWDTTVTRNGNKVTFTFYELNGNGLNKLTSSDKKLLKQSFKDDGWTIK